MSERLTPRQFQLLKQINERPVLPSARIRADLAVLEKIGYVWAVSILYVEYDITDAGRRALEGGGG